MHTMGQAQGVHIIGLECQKMQQTDNSNLIQV